MTLVFIFAYNYSTHCTKKTPKGTNVGPKSPMDLVKPKAYLRRSETFASSVLFTTI